MNKQFLVNQLASRLRESAEVARRAERDAADEARDGATAEPLLPPQVGAFEAVAGVLAYLAHVGMMFGGGRREGSNPLVAIFTVILAMVAAAMLKAMISRSREYVADYDGAVIAGSPLGLASALRRLEAYSQRIPLDTPNPAANNLFIVEPLTGGGIMNMFASHPPTEKRVAALMRQAEEMAARGQVLAA